MIYKYGYKLRPPSIGTQPKGYLELEDKGISVRKDKNGYWGYATYDRKLTDKEMFEYDLELLEVE